MTRTIQELREEKIRKTLARNLQIAHDPAITDAERSSIIADLTPSILDGSHVKKDNADFVITTENGKHSYFLKKPESSIDMQFGIGLARILSDKKVAFKRHGAFLVETQNRFSSAIKWDSAAAPDRHNPNEDRIFLDEVVIYPEYNNTEFRKKYARLCALLYVFGDSDDNPTNFLCSRKTQNPLRIDWNPLTNDRLFSFNYNKILEPTKRYRIYGSAQADYLLSNYFQGKHNKRVFCNIKKALQENACKKMTNTFQKNTDDIDKLRAAIDEYATFHYGLNSKSVNDENLEKIKLHIAKPHNKDVKEEFIEFMEGIKDAIELAHNDEFLDAYAQKFRDEISPDAYGIALTCKEFFKENVKDAQMQFKKYLKLLEELKQELSAPPALARAETPQAAATESEVPATDPLKSDAQKLDELKELMKAFTQPGAFM